MTHDKVAVVAGVGPGIGARFVETFAQEGYRVVALARSADSLEKIRVGLRELRLDASSGRSTLQTRNRSRKRSFVCGRIGPHKSVDLQRGRRGQEGFFS